MYVDVFTCSGSSTSSAFWYNLPAERSVSYGPRLSFEVFLSCADF